MTFQNIFSKNPIKKENKKIIVDHREKNSLVISELMKLGFELEFKQLPVADYIINKTAIERKTISDFKSSIINKRIMNQLLELKQYPNHFLILEGLKTESPYSGGMHENAFRGFLLSIINDYKVPIIFTLNEKDTAKYLSVFAKKEKKAESSLRVSKKTLSEKERLLFILEGFPELGPKTTKKLIEHFKTLKNIFNASEKELTELIGKKAEPIIKLINFEYS